MLQIVVDLISSLTNSESDLCVTEVNRQVPNMSPIFVEMNFRHKFIIPVSFIF